MIVHHKTTVVVSVSEVDNGTLIYSHFGDGQSVETKQLDKVQVSVDYNAKGELIGFEILA